MQTVFPAIEPLRAEEAGDGMDLPVYNINIGGAQSFGVTVKRHGLRLKTRSLRLAEQQTPHARTRSGDALVKEALLSRAHWRCETPLQSARGCQHLGVFELQLRVSDCREEIGFWLFQMKVLLTNMSV